MLPHSNMGIRFRTHFEPIGLSIHRTTRKMIDGKLKGASDAYKKGFIKKEAYETIIRECDIILKSLKKKQRKRR